MARSFRDLLVWQKASALAVDVYRMTAGWPREEVYGLTSQVRRCVVSVSSNIAEGEGRKSAKDFARFLKIAQGSLRELESQMFIAQALGYIDSNVLDDITARCAEIGRMSAALSIRLREQADQ